MTTNLSDALRVVAGLAEKATPGPWKYVPWHVEEDCSAVRAPDGHLICQTASDDTASAIAAAVNFIREHGAALARALEDSARLDFVLEQLGADEASALFSNKEMMAEEVRANIDAAIAAQQKEAANA